MLLRESGPVPNREERRRSLAACNHPKRIHLSAARCAPDEGRAPGASGHWPRACMQLNLPATGWLAFIFEPAFMR
jgi:hypothetical protein